MTDDLVDAVSKALQPLYEAVEVVLLDHEDEISGGNVDPNIAELALRYERLTGWTVDDESRETP